MTGTFQVLTLKQGCKSEISPNKTLQHCQNSKSLSTLNKYFQWPYRLQNYNGHFKTAYNFHFQDITLYK